MTNEAGDRIALEDWREFGEGDLSTLELRAACHAAQREGDEAAERRLSGEISDREDKGER